MDIPTSFILITVLCNEVLNMAVVRKFNVILGQTLTQSV
jgi:hypothetical protein